MPLGTGQHSGPDLTDLILLEESGRKRRSSCSGGTCKYKASLVEIELARAGPCPGIQSGVGLGSQSDQEGRQVVHSCPY